MESKQVYTLRAVSRPTDEKYAFLVLRVDWNMRKDMFSFNIDGQHVEWHRRGMPIFDSRSDGCAYVRQHGWPLG